MLPHPVVELLERQLLQNATDTRRTGADRADAVYEHALAVLSANDPGEAGIDNGLELLTFADRNGLVEAQATVGRLKDAFRTPLATSRDEEIGWLLAASCSGSTTAQRRFRDLDIERFTAVIRDVHQGNGATCPLLNQTLLLCTRQGWQARHLANITYGYLHESTFTGNAELLLKIPPELPAVCIMTVVEILLTRGANAAHGVTPLHFLAAFDDDTPRVASALLQHGADIGKVCERALIYKELFDSPFGEVGGTRLLWVVAAGNHCAAFNSVSTSSTEESIIVTTLSCVNLLVESGVDPTCFTKPTKLVYAAPSDCGRL
ncbi:hypothetical protein AJ78_01394 [Emergomyces pasteurianus Ep9510]|uniref:Uncharacterized protein n=1 Tax=Emergomyces pasteurianus Ep9510 TaxID=1447872 RepID=A0A1J9QR10_9EURO|nr:hypothetical protein AJ78_01394 [Emergomyces pasteurianus Ep9510]